MNAIPTRFRVSAPRRVQDWYQVHFERGGIGGEASGKTPEAATREAMAVVQATLQRDATHAR